MTSWNKYGLTRNIPEPVKREVRQACGFGCVICGASIYEYEHVEPLFAEAKEHDPTKITLLCSQCHSKVTRGMLSKETVLRAMSNPKCKQRGFASELFDIGKQHPAITFGGVRFEGCPIPIQVHEFPVFEIKEAEEPEGPFRLSANFFNGNGEQSLTITDNEWRAFNGNWDINVVGKSITVWDTLRQVSLRLATDPPNGITVEKINMLVAGWRFIGNQSKLSIYDPNGYPITFYGGVLSGQRVGMMLGGSYL